MIFRKVLIRAMVSLNCAERTGGAGIHARPAAAHARHDGIAPRIDDPRHQSTVR